LSTAASISSAGSYNDLPSFLAVPEIKRCSGVGD